MIEELWRNGEVPCVLVGGKRVVEKVDLDAWCDKQAKKTGKLQREMEQRGRTMSALSDCKGLTETLLPKPAFIRAHCARTVHKCVIYGPDINMSASVGFISFASRLSFSRASRFILGFI